MKLSFASTALFATFFTVTTAENSALRVLRGQPGSDAPEDLAQCPPFNGNGFPKGKGIKPVFRLKLLGRDLAKREEWNYEPNSGNNIAISLNSRTKILLENSDATDSNDCTEECPEDYCVVDANGTDGEAKLCLRDPFPSFDTPCIPDVDESSCDEEAVFRIFARVRGKGSISFTSCIDVEDGDSGSYEICDTGNTITLPKLDEKKAIDISQNLLVTCVDGSGIGLFDEVCGEISGESFSIQKCDGDNDLEEQFFWDVDNNGVRNAELRFYSQAELDALVEGECTWEAVTRGKCA